VFWLYVVLNLVVLRLMFTQVPGGFIPIQDKALPDRLVIACPKWHRCDPYRGPWLVGSLSVAMNTKASSDCLALSAFNCVGKGNQYPSGHRVHVFDDFAGGTVPPKRIADDLNAQLGGIQWKVLRITFCANHRVFRPWAQARVIRCNPGDRRGAELR